MQKKRDNENTFKEFEALATVERQAAEEQHRDTLGKLVDVVKRGACCPAGHAFKARLGAKGETCVNCGADLLFGPIVVCVGRRCGFMVCHSCQEPTGDPSLGNLACWSLGITKKTTGDAG